MPAVRSTMTMEDKGINLSWNGNPCGCRCDHCLLSSGTQTCGVGYEEAKGIVERFLRWRGDTDSRGGFAMGFAVGFSAEFPQLPDYVRFRFQNGMQGSDSLQVGGIRKRSGADLRSFLEGLARAGVRRLGLSFHGMGDSHDRCTRRSGDYEFLIDMARTAAELGMGRFETVFLRKSTIEELPALLKELDAIPGLDDRYVGPFDYRGRAKLLEADRPTLADLEKTPDSFRHNVNRATLRSESEWMRHIASCEIPAKGQRYYLIPISDHAVPQLQRDDPDEILARMREADDKLANQVPPLRELANRHGAASSGRLYALRDLEWKWTDAFLTEHSHIDAAGVFDDQTPCILWR